MPTVSNRGTALVIDLRVHAKPLFFSSKNRVYRASSSIINEVYNYTKYSSATAQPSSNIARIRNGFLGTDFAKTTRRRLATGAFAVLCYRFPMLKLMDDLSIQDAK